jgi:hypothetical protein
LQIPISINQIKIAGVIFVKAVRRGHYRIDVSPVGALFIAGLKKTESSDGAYKKMVDYVGDNECAFHRLIAGFFSN